MNEDKNPLSMTKFQISVEWLVPLIMLYVADTYIYIGT